MRINNYPRLRNRLEGTSVTLAPAGVWMDISANAHIKLLGKKLEATPFYQKVQIIDKPLKE